MQKLTKEQQQLLQELKTKNYPGQLFYKYWKLPEKSLTCLKIFSNLSQIQMVFLKNKVQALSQKEQYKNENQEIKKFIKNLLEIKDLVKETLREEIKPVLQGIQILNTANQIREKRENQREDDRGGLAGCLKIFFIFVLGGIVVIIATASVVTSYLPQKQYAPKIWGTAGGLITCILIIFFIYLVHSKHGSPHYDEEEIEEMCKKQHKK